MKNQGLRMASGVLVLLSSALFSLADEAKEFAPPVVALVESHEGKNIVTVAGKKTTAAGLADFCRESISRFGSIGGVNIVFKGDVSFDEALLFRKSLPQKNLGPLRFFVCPARLWNPRSLTPAQWEEVVFSELRIQESGKPRIKATTQPEKTKPH